MVDLYNLYRQHPCITTDSRDCPEGSIFIALHGDKFDGNQFALQALEKGCSYAIVDKEFSVESLELSDFSKASQRSMLNAKLIKVPDTLQALKDIAREHRRQFDIPVIAITGTNGKTTTKELVRAVLSEKYNVLATEGNYNNDVGVPKTLLRLTKEHEIAIIEMGASHPGDIKTLVETAEPTCGIITNVGHAHLQGFGSFEGVCKTKGELYDYLRTRKDGLVFVNADNEFLIDMLDTSDDENLWITPYSTDPEKQYACISGEIIREEGNPLLKMRWRRPLMDLEESGASQKWHKVQTQLIGDYNIDNVMAAIAVGINFGVERKSICHAIENYRPTNSRSQLLDTAKNRLIVDAYNANPTSMMAALENFLLLQPAPGQEKMVILGDMLELGPASIEEHQKVVNMLQDAGMEHVWLVGHEFATVLGDLQSVQGELQSPLPFRTFADVDEVKAELQTNCPEGRLILIKGSNSTRLHQLPPLL
ncbi:MAG: UDP-N-acetylmuramoyl-tripeptide--D-alanyl-D-alanine ligase [Prevotella sp.]|nr:UDP-N-acetylmuramoyl-tripeptide--D-alanyl-D-alanine ligase [Prevotella sp.]